MIENVRQFCGEEAAATRILNLSQRIRIKDRQLDNYFQLEENAAKQTKAQIMEILNDNDKGNEPVDKLRLFIIWFLSTEQEVNRQEFEGFEKALSEAGADVSCLPYVRQ